MRADMRWSGVTHNYLLNEIPSQIGMSLPLRTPNDKYFCLYLTRDCALNLNHAFPD